MVEGENGSQRGRRLYAPEAVTDAGAVATLRTSIVPAVCRRFALREFGATGAAL
jgi:hypothetical protein